MAVKHRIRICIGYNQDGSPILKQLGANSEAELGDMAVRVILASERKGEFIQDVPSKIICLPEAKENAAPLLGDYAWTWFRTYKAQNIKPTTANFYDLLLRNICQGLGDKPVDEITTADIQGFLNANDGKARSYVNQMRRLIRWCCNRRWKTGSSPAIPGTASASPFPPPRSRSANRCARSRSFKSSRAFQSLRSTTGATWPYCCSQGCARGKYWACNGRT